MTVAGQARRHHRAQSGTVSLMRPRATWTWRVGVGAALVSSLAADEPASIESALLAGLPSWRVRLAFFPLERQTPEPDREQGFRVFSNGIVDELVIDYGDFSIDANLEALSALGVWLVAS